MAHRSHAQLPDALEQLRWIRHAHQLGLVNEELVILFIGREEGHLKATAYIQQDESTSIPVSFSRELRSLPPQASQ